MTTEEKAAARRRLKELREEVERMPADLLATTGSTRERHFRRLAEIRQEIINLYGKLP